MARPRKDERYSIVKGRYKSGKVYHEVSGYKLDGTRVREKYKLKPDAIKRRSQLELEDQLAIG